MAYIHSKYETCIDFVADLTTATDQFIEFSPGLIPHYIRGAAIVITTDTDGDPGEVQVNFRPIAGSNTGKTTMATIPIPAGVVAGKVLFVDTTDSPLLNQVIKPGESCIMEVTTAMGGGSKAGAGRFQLYLEPTWEVPGDNNPNMIKV